MRFNSTQLGRKYSLNDAQLRKVDVLMEHLHTTGLPSHRIDGLVFAPRLHRSLSCTSALPGRNGSQTKHIQANSRWIEPRPLGLWNSGQSCHLGATITALGAVPLLRDWLKCQRVKTRSSFSVLRQYLLDSLASNSKQGSQDPRPLLSILEKSGWKSRHAQDAHETMARLLEILDDWCVVTNGGEGSDFRAHSGLILWNVVRGSAGKSESPKMRMPSRTKRVPFSTLLWTMKRCEGCGNQGPLSFQPSLMLTLPAPACNVNLVRLIAKTYMSSELVEMKCDQCTQVCMHTWTTGIKMFPQLLVLQLQKAVYTHGGIGTAAGKVAIPRRFMMPTCKGGGKVNRECFNLRSVVRHRGGMGKDSHFDCVVAQDCDDSHYGLVASADLQRWWSVNDDSVLHCDVAAASNPALAYLLIYERRTDDRDIEF